MPFSSYALAVQDITRGSSKEFLWQGFQDFLRNSFMRYPDTFLEILSPISKEFMLKSLQEFFEEFLELFFYEFFRNSFFLRSSLRTTPEIPHRKPLFKFPQAIVQAFLQVFLQEIIKRLA